MHIIVCIKETLDLPQVRMNRETREPILRGVPWLIGEIDKNALEEASRIKAQTGSKVTVLSIGYPQTEETILEALARGADEAVSVADTALQNVDSAGKVKVIAKMIQKIGSYDLILMAQGSADNNSAQTGPRVAQLLGLPQVGYIRRLEVVGDKLRAVRNLEDCLETVEVPMPAVVSVVGEINEPPIPPITAILEASSKPLKKFSLSEIGITSEELKSFIATEVLSNKYPEQERKNILFEGELGKAVDSFVKSLVEEGVLEV